MGTFFVDIRRLELDTDGSAARRDHSGDDDVEDADDAIIFDKNRDNGGRPLRVSLEDLATWSLLLDMRRVPPGRYDRAEVELDGAYADIAEAGTPSLPLVLAGNGDGPDEFEIDLSPAVSVARKGTTLVTLAFAPIVSFVNGEYVLSHDGSGDASGEDLDGAATVRFTGVVHAVSEDGSAIALVGLGLPVSLAVAAVSSSAPPDAPPGEGTPLAPGATVTIEGLFDAWRGLFIATAVTIH